jgi:histidine ammonia-lyase
MEPIILDGKSLSLAEIARFMRHAGIRVELEKEASERVRGSRATVERTLASNATVYGITTGFGRLAEKRIDANQLADLQRNLVRSHCAGVGGPLSANETRLLMLLRANALAKGYSGVRLETLEALLAMLNAGVLPVVPSKGSVGASGDLAPLAHLAAVLIGEGKAIVNGVEMPGVDALERARLRPVQLEAKEGLSLINGTQLILAIGVRSVLAARSLVKQADVVAAMTIDALLGTDVAFDARIHAVRPHSGQKSSAKNLRRLLYGSQIRESHRGPLCKKVQDPYSLRCAPQVHGAVRDALGYIEKTLVTELNSATDNPLVFPELPPDVPVPENGYVLSGGNFHGAPCALALDILAVAMCQLGTISERRIERLVNPDYSGLPPFLTKAPAGLNSGLMMAQVTAAALVSENKVLAHPASVDSIPTSAGFEDHVSMGPAAARKAREVVINLEHVYAIELIAAAQAIDFHRPLRSSDALEAAHAAIRDFVPTLEADRPLTPDIEKAVALIRSEQMLRDVDAKLREAIE